MLILSVLLFIVYVIYFRADGGSLQSALKILKGLNSNTFNYLEANKHTIRADTKPIVFEADKEITSTAFFSQCVRVNKPCRLNKLAVKWPAYDAFDTLNKPFEQVK